MAKISRALLLLLVASWPAFAGDEALCRNAIAAAERAGGVPDRLMQAIGVVESGRRGPGGGVAPWPWTINVEGAGEVFDTKQQAIAAVVAHRARGARSIDVGCMQVNLLHHADAFGSLDDAFDPAANARYAARFLQQLLAQTGSWPRAVAGYHSLTPEIGDGYAKKVLAAWARPEPRGALPGPWGSVGGSVGASAAASAGQPAPGPASALAALPASAPARLLPLPGGGPTLVGRGLESYRAMPTRMVTANLVRRP